MSKKEVIERILAKNPSARRDCLRCFSLRELTNYRRELDSNAVRTLRRGGSLTALAQAVGDLMERSIPNPAATLDLIEALNHGGFVAEQGALALYRRLGLKVPRDRSKVELRPAIWRKRVKAWLSDIEARIEVRLTSLA